MVKSQRNERTQTRLNRGLLKLGTIAKFSRALNMFTVFWQWVYVYPLNKFPNILKKIKIFRKIFLNISVAKFPK